jgi:hypothetical protein
MTFKEHPSILVTLGLSGHWHLSFLMRPSARPEDEVHNALPMQHWGLSTEKGHRCDGGEREHWSSLVITKKRALKLWVLFSEEKRGMDNALELFRVGTVPDKPPERRQTTVISTHGKGPDLSGVTIRTSSARC